MKQFDSIESTSVSSQHSMLSVHCFSPVASAFLTDSDIFDGDESMDLRSLFAPRVDLRGLLHGGSSSYK